MDFIVATFVTFTADSEKNLVLYFFKTIISFNSAVTYDFFEQQLIQLIITSE